MSISWTCIFGHKTAGRGLKIFMDKDLAERERENKRTKEKNTNEVVCFSFDLQCNGHAIEQQDSYQIWNSTFVEYSFQPASNG
jgi:hypothetical protein